MYLKIKSLGLNECEAKIKKDLFTGKYKKAKIFKKGVALKKIDGKLKIVRS